MLKLRLSLLVLFLFGTFLFNKTKGCLVKQHSNSIENNKIPSTIQAKSKQALVFCKSKRFNTNYCILVDLSLHSGVKRFYVWDFKKNTISFSSMVSHGCGRMPWSWAWSKDNPGFSNEDGSHCSSTGKYRIGKRGYSNWGIHVNYLLYGLETSNSNALKRQIVLHSWDKVPEDEVYPGGTQEGWGCPAISNKSLELLDKKLKSSKKPVLLWIYN
jgi:hypothetical protein